MSCLPHEPAYATVYEYSSVDFFATLHIWLKTNNSGLVFCSILWVVHSAWHCFEGPCKVVASYKCAADAASLGGVCRQARPKWWPRCETARGGAWARGRKWLWPQASLWGPRWATLFTDTFEAAAVSNMWTCMLFLWLLPFMLWVVMSWWTCKQWI